MKPKLSKISSPIKLVKFNHLKEIPSSKIMVKPLDTKDLKDVLNQLKEPDLLNLEMS